MYSCAALEQYRHTVHDFLNMIKSKNHATDTCCYKLLLGYFYHIPTPIVTPQKSKATKRLFCFFKQKTRRSLRVLFERNHTGLHASLHANVEYPANNVAAVKGHLIVLLKVLCTHSQ